MTNENVISATLTFNDEWVTNKPEKIYYPFPKKLGEDGKVFDVVTDATGETYISYIPRYGCVVLRFETKKKI